MSEPRLADVAGRGFFRFYAGLWKYIVEKGGITWKSCKGRMSIAKDTRHCDVE
jgi:hypothetical protein